MTTLPLLPLIWAGIIALGVIIYVLLDGFDLGIGILFPWVKEPQNRDIMMNTVAPVWDGNETWLVLGGALLYGAFPLAYSTLLPTLYIPISFMLFGLIFRGLAFEFRFKANKSKKIWDWAFTLGSILAAFMQGIVLGTFVESYAVIHQSVGVFEFAWLTPFTLITGIAVVIGYALLGATWLIAKTSDELQQFMFKAAKLLLIGTVICLLVVSLWTPFISSTIMARWFSLPNFFYLAILPLMTVITVIYAFIALHKQREKGAFVACLGLFVFAYTGFIISIWPYIVPPKYTIWEAAASPSSLKFLLVGAVILLPVLMVYNIYQYRVFRGKTTADTGYHD